MFVCHERKSFFCTDVDHPSIHVSIHLPIHPSLEEPKVFFFLKCCGSVGVEEDITDLFLCLRSSFLLRFRLEELVKERERNGESWCAHKARFQTYEESRREPEANRLPQAGIR